MANGFLFMLAVAAVLDLPEPAVTRSQAEPGHPAVERVLGEFEAPRALDIEHQLRLRRLPSPSPRIRQRAHALLPDKGGVTPNARQAVKLAALQPVLALHGRDADLSIRMFAEGGVAWTGLVARSILLLSREAVDLLDVDELRAIVAHELGHDVLWRDYEAAARQRDTRRREELELRCDGLAVLALHRLGLPPHALVTAVQKLAQHNAAALASVDETGYVPLGDRVRFIRRLAARIPPPADLLSTDRAPGRRP